jgi:hypothetical protein
VLYNAGHLWLRLWGLRVGWREGLRVAPSLGTTILQQGPQTIGRAGAVLGGVMLPVIFHRIADPADAERMALGIAIVVSILTAALLVRLQGRLEGWKIGLVVLSLVAIISSFGS